jgi:hypothetical protein
MSERVVGVPTLELFLDEITSSESYTVPKAFSASETFEGLQ